MGAAGVERGDRFQTLLGVTGSGKTMTIAHVIRNIGNCSSVQIDDAFPWHGFSTRARIDSP